MQVLTEKNTMLSQELEKCKAQLEAALAATGEPKGTRSGKIHFERLVLCGLSANLTIHVADGAGLDPEKQLLIRRLKAGESVLTKVRREKNDLQDAYTKLDVELKDVRGQLSDSMKENQRLRRGIFSKCLSELLKKRSSARKTNNRIMSVGTLTGRPAEEMPGSTGDLLPELLQLHERIRRAMQGVARALWPAHSTPEGLGELAEKLTRARWRIRLWKISACQQA